MLELRFCFCLLFIAVLPRAVAIVESSTAHSTKQNTVKKWASQVRQSVGQLERVRDGRVGLLKPLVGRREALGCGAGK